jgi:putative hydrolase of the HAD superfamily
MTIRNIIFDLGGVLLNLDFERTFKAFDALGVSDFQRYFQQSYSNPLFEELEKGICSPESFYAGFRATTGISADNKLIADAWNAMLLDFRQNSMAYLETLKGQYRIFLLSNTNQIHLEAFREIHFQQYGHHEFDSHFEKAWYSHEIGLRKPNPDCYKAVLQQKGLLPEETLFVDDTAINIEGAKQVGLQTLLLPKKGFIETEMPPLFG